MARDFEYFVIGAGSGGVRSARVAGNLGARVAIAEMRDLGGTCVNVGCVPKKLFVYSARFRDSFAAASAYGWTVDVGGFDWNRLVDNKNREIARLNGLYNKTLDSAGVELIRGKAELVGPHTIRVGEREVTADNILVATGGWPSIPDIPGAEHAISSNEAFFLEEFPRRVLMVGGGYISLEFASIFRGMGADVTLVHRGERLLKHFDEDVQLRLAEELETAGIELRFGSTLERIDRGDDGLTVQLDHGDSLTVDQVFFATGRRPKSGGLGLEAIGVALNESGAIVVDEDYRTSVPHIYAVGDVTDRVALTPVAIAEGHVLAVRLFGDGSRTMSYDNIPTAVFTTPEVAAAGLTEAEARARFDNVDVYVSTFRPMVYSLVGTNTKAMMKLVVDADSDKVLGCHMVGDGAAEIIQGLAVALQASATKATFDLTMALHPTAAEEFVLMSTPRS